MMQTAADQLRLRISKLEKVDLVNFLQTLIDESLVADVRFSNTFN